MSKAERLRRGGQRDKSLFSTDVQRDARFFKERDRERLVNAEKTRHLRALRLEKEARDVAEKALLPQTPPARRAVKVALSS